MFKAIAMSYSKSYYNSLTKPFDIISIDAEGNWSTFSPELLGEMSKKYNNFIFGNLVKEKISESKMLDLLYDITNEINQGVISCKALCEYYNVCKGGNPSNKWSENKNLSSTETISCRIGVQALADACMDFIEGNLN